MKRYSLLIVLAIALAACASGAAPSSTTITSPVNVPQPTVSSTNATSPLAPPEPMDVASATPEGRVAVFPNTIIVYQREGGFAGKTGQWTFYFTGRIVAGDGTEWQVPADQAKPLFDLAEAPDYWKLNERYPAKGTCNDCYTHTLTVYQKGETKTVIFVEGTDLPTNLQQMLDEINQLISR
ncbi:MAG TPA: hypothetical protein VLG46_10625 [Anaerolineae bacterium]|nr:hypothetical protein [Anaerolineae bacterium]